MQKNIIMKFSQDYPYPINLLACSVWFYYLKANGSIQNSLNEDIMDNLVWEETNKYIKSVFFNSYICVGDYIDNAIYSINEKDKTAIYYLFKDRYNYDFIAEKLGVTSEESVTEHLFESIKILIKDFDRFKNNKEIFYNESMCYNALYRARKGELTGYRNSYNFKFKKIDVTIEYPFSILCPLCGCDVDYMRALPQYKIQKLTKALDRTLELLIQKSHFGSREITLIGEIKKGKKRKQLIKDCSLSANTINKPCHNIYKVLFINTRIREYIDDVLNDYDFVGEIIEPGVAGDKLFVEQVDFPLRTYYKLCRARIYRLYEITEHSEGSLLREDQIGPTIVEEIKGVLAKQGLSLKNEPEPKEEKIKSLDDVKKLPLEEIKKLHSRFLFLDNKICNRIAMYLAHRSNKINAIYADATFLWIDDILSLSEKEIYQNTGLSANSAERLINTIKELGLQFNLTDETQAGTHTEYKIVIYKSTIDNISNQQINEEKVTLYDVNDEDSSNLNLQELIKKYSNKKGDNLNYTELNDEEKEFVQQQIYNKIVDFYKMYGKLPKSHQEKNMIVLSVHETVQDNNIKINIESIKRRFTVIINKFKEVEKQKRIDY